MRRAALRALARVLPKILPRLGFEREVGEGRRWLSRRAWVTVDDAGIFVELWFGDRDSGKIELDMNENRDGSVEYMVRVCHYPGEDYT